MDTPAPYPQYEGMPAHTAADAAQLAAVYADRVLVTTTRDVHRAVAGRVFGLTGQRHSPVGVLHDIISGGVYAAVGLVTRTLGRVGELGVGKDTDLEQLPRGRRMRSIVNGLVGDVLAEGGNPSAIAPAFRRHAGDVALNPAALATAFPDATERLVIFVHGLCEDDECWSYRCDERGPTYLERLSGAGRWTPIALRYNSGEPVRDNAATLARLVDELVDAWPREVREVREVAFVGHSMGGLIVRAAAASARGMWWSDRVGHVVLLGSPHGGAPLERLVKRAVPGMQRVPEMAPFATILDERSIGIRDLHDGIGFDTVVWERATYHCVGATLGRSEKGLLGRMFGDLLVLLDSARGLGADVDADFRHIVGAHHFDLLNHPLIHADLERWLGEPVDSDLQLLSASTPDPRPVVGRPELTSRAGVAARPAGRCAAGRRAGDPTGAG